MEWIEENLAVLLLGVHGLALAIINTTPTPKDDGILKIIYKVVEIVAGVLTPKVKD